MLLANVVAWVSAVAFDIYTHCCQAAPRPPDADRVFIEGFDPIRIRKAWCREGESNPHVLADNGV